MKTKLTTASMLAALFAFAVVMSPACEDDDVGIPCQISGEDSTDTLGVRVRGDALDCRSRICIRYRRFDQTAEALCTEPCGSADDCPDSTETCPEGFSCVIGQTSGGLQCCRFCVCRKYLADPNVDPAQDLCANKESKCPNL